ncbi:MAG: deoxyribose-phosphate aldolase [Treponema sp.]|jgi:deoxyribose-phosphate aldolase|nr:deoxyribose-phosphate aldolase [Treponema sp.]
MGKRALTVADIAFTLDHSLLRPELTIKEVREGCDTARQYGCVSVCVRPSDLPVVIESLKGSEVLSTTVIAFPHGTAATESKLFEIKDALDKGAVEVDMVMNYARFLSGEVRYVEEEIAAAAECAHGGGALLKVIFENYYLSTEQIIQCCRICRQGGVDFVKTSTGYAPGGAVISDLITMVKHADGMRVKAAGGVRTLDDALAVIATGTARIGTRSSQAILEEAKQREARGELFLGGTADE